MNNNSDMGRHPNDSNRNSILSVKNVRLFTNTQKDINLWLAEKLNKDKIS